WNRSADVVLRWLLERGLVSACVLAFALAAFVVLRARLRLTAPLFTASLAVLLVPVVRLLPDALMITPVGRPVDFLAERLGPLPAVPEETGPAEAERTGANAPVLAANAPAEQIAEPALLARPTVGAWLLLAWASVALSLLVVLVRNQLRVRRLVRAAVPSGRDAVEECARLARELGVTRPVRCLETDALDSPATWGVRRPVVLLPRGLSSRLAAAERRWILLHELHHVRRADVVQQ